MADRDVASEEQQAAPAKRGKQAAPAAEEQRAPKPAALLEAADAQQGLSDAGAEDAIGDLLEAGLLDDVEREAEEDDAPRARRRQPAARRDDDEGEDDGDAAPVQTRAPNGRFSGPQDEGEEGDEDADADEGEEAPPAKNGRAPRGAESEDEGEDDGEEIRSVSDLARVFEVEEEDFAGRIVISTEDGRETTLRDVIEGYRSAPRSYQLARDAESIRDSLKIERDTFTAERNKILNELVPIRQELLEELQADEQTLARLKSDDPEGYDKARLRMYERREKFQKLDSKLREEWERNETQRAEAHAKWKASEWTAFQARVPTWKDPKVMRAESAITSQYLQNVLGFSAEEVDDMNDHRIGVMARDAALAWHSRQRAAKKTREAKGSLRIPKGFRLPAGTRAARASEKVSSDARRRVGRGAGTDRDADRALEELL